MGIWEQGKYFWGTVQHFILENIQITLWRIGETLEIFLGNMGTHDPLGGLTSLNANIHYLDCINISIKIDDVLLCI